MTIERNIRMKGVLLAGGDCTRIQEQLTVPTKCLIPIGGRTLLEYNLIALQKLCVEEIIIIVGKNGDALARAVGQSYAGIPLRCIRQPVPLGIVHALTFACEAIGEADFALRLGDELFIEEKTIEVLDFWNSSGADCVCGVTQGEPLEALRNNYSLLVEGDAVLDLVEKPEHPFNDYKGTGFCLFRNCMLQYLDQTPVNAKTGQYDLCDWIRLAIRDKRSIKLFLAAKKEINVNTAEDLRRARMLLECTEGECS